MRSVHIKFLRLSSILIIILMLSGLFSSPALAEPAAVHSVLFYSPTCPHCHKVMTESLPPLQQKYGAQLVIFNIDITTPDGRLLYQNAIDQLNISEDMQGVPTLIVGSTVLVGSADIPAKFPGLIEAGLAAGGIDWPVFPGLTDAIQAAEAGTTQPAAVGLQATAASPVVSTVNQDNPDENVFITRFKHDLVGNSIAVVVLVAMLISLLVIGYLYIQGTGYATADWIIPILCIIGIGVAGYLSYVELANAAVICGPLHGCDTVQQSQYSRLFGILPVGVLGLIGYFGIGAAWLVKAFGPEGFKRLAMIAMWAMALFGVLFSVYLTFLEPFIIGATCTWCITSAIVITLLLWASSGPGITALSETALSETE